MKLFTCFVLPIYTGKGKNDSSCYSPTRILTRKILMRIQVVIFLLLFTALHINAKVFAQKVTLHLKQQPLEKAFLEIEKATGMVFFYPSSLMEKSKPVTLQLSNASLEEALKASFKEQPMDYEIIGKMIKVMEKAATPPVKAKPIKIRGKVTDKNNVPLPAVSVRVRGTNVGTVTDANGNYAIEAEPDAILVFSSVGFQAMEIKINSQTELNLTLIENEAQLNETVIKGYYNTTKELNTGNVATVKSNVISSQPVTNLLQALSGRVAGVQITETNGLPGAPVIVQIRGRNSLNTTNPSANLPLYIVDGVPFPSVAIELTAGPANGAGTLGSPLNNISPSDIERIEILKDADATSIYGSRGSNGVILITTKKGSSGTTSFNASYTRGSASATRIPKVLNTSEFLEFRRTAFNNSSVIPNVANAPELFTYDQQTDFKWPEWLIGNIVHRNDAMATLSGGNGKTSFLVSGNYHDENSLRNDDDKFRRAGFHINGNHASTDGKLTLTSDVFYTGSKTKLQSGGLSIVSVYGAFPNYPVYTPEGNYNWASVSNNYVAQAEAYYKTNTDNLNANIKLSYKILDNLQFSLNSGLNKISADQMSVTPSIAISPALSTTTTANTIFAKQFTNSIITEPMISYNPTIGHHHIELLVGGTYQSSRTRGNLFTLNGYTNINQQESTNFGTVSQKSDNIADYKYLSAFARVGYNWNSKYVLNATFRRDGSSRFGPGRQFANFYSIGAAWLFSKELAIQRSIPWISSGKLRGSYGSTGSDAIPDYGFLSLFNTGAQYGNMNTLLPSQVANENYRWEVNRKLEMAIELGALKDRLQLSIAYFKNRSDNQLVGYPLPSTTGFTSYQANLPALVENRGFELEMYWTNIEKKKFKWTASANLTAAGNKLLQFDGIEKTSYANSYVVGRSLSIVQGYKLIRINPENGVPEFEDQNKDGVFTNRSSFNKQGGDYVILGQTNPTWYAGLANNFKLGQLSFDIFLQYTRQQGYTYIKQIAGFGRLNPFKEFSNYWKQNGDETIIPKPYSTSNIGLINYNVSSPTFGDASFLRVKNINISYEFTPYFAKSGIKKCILFVQGQNLFTITRYKILDPEVAGDANARVPLLKILTIGLQVSL